MKYALIADSIMYTSTGEAYLFPELVCIGTKKQCLERMDYETSRMNLKYDSTESEYGFAVYEDERGEDYTFVIQPIHKG